MINFAVFKSQLKTKIDHNIYFFKNNHQDFKKKKEDFFPFLFIRIG